MVFWNVINNKVLCRKILVLAMGNFRLLCLFEVVCFLVVGVVVVVVILWSFFVIWLVFLCVVIWSCWFLEGQEVFK